MKTKSPIFEKLINMLKCCLIGITITLVGIVIFAFVLKFSDLKTSTINYVNNIIKIVALFFVVLFLKKFDSEKLLVRSAITGAMYAVLCFVLFSILNRGFSFDSRFLFDLIFAVVVAIIASVILNLTKKKA